MKQPNPYIWLMIIWSVLTVAFQVASVVCYVEVNSGVGAILGGCSVGFAFTVGWLFAKAVQIAELNRQQKWLTDFAKDLREWAQEVAREQEGKPFAEFDNPSEAPFPEVERKEK